MIGLHCRSFPFAACMASGMSGGSLRVRAVRFPHRRNNRLIAPLSWAHHMPKKPPGRCIFCNDTGLSDEHLLPNKWMRRIFQRGASDLRKYRTKAGTIKDRTLFEPTRLENIIGGSIFSITLHVVCKTRCNNGWMHNLEDQTGPLLIQLIRGNPGTLTTSGQNLLAKWLVKTTMVAEYIEPDDVTFTSEQRRRMMETLEIPDGCQIWLGTTTGQRWRNAIEHVSGHGITELRRASGPHSPPAALGDAQVTFFGLNTFLAIVFSSSKGAVIRFNFQGEWITGLKQIWPLANPNISLPGFAMRDEEVDAAFRWFESILFPSGLHVPL